MHFFINLRYVAFRVELIMLLLESKVIGFFMAARAHGRHTQSESRPNLRIKPRMYVRRSIMYAKAVFLLAGAGAKIKSVACGFSSIYSCYIIVLVQSNLSLYWQGFCDISVTLCGVSVTLSKWT